MRNYYLNIFSEPQIFGDVENLMIFHFLFMIHLGHYLLTLDISGFLTFHISMEITFTYIKRLRQNIHLYAMKIKYLKHYYKGKKRC